MIYFPQIVLSKMVWMEFFVIFNSIQRHSKCFSTSFEMLFQFYARLLFLSSSSRVCIWWAFVTHFHLDLFRINFIFVWSLSKWHDNILQHRRRQCTCKMCRIATTATCANHGWTCMNICERGRERQCITVRWCWWRWWSGMVWWYDSLSSISMHICSTCVCVCVQIELDWIDFYFMHIGRHVWSCAVLFGPEYLFLQLFIHFRLFLSCRTFNYAILITVQ